MLDGALPLYLQCDAQIVGNTWYVNHIDLFRDDSYAMSSLVAGDVDFALLSDESQLQLKSWIEQAWRRETQVRSFMDHFDHFISLIETRR